METTTKQGSAQLILELFNLRREEKMRKARDWFFQFTPHSMEDLSKVYEGDSAYFRMIIGYWEMAAALVNHGAIDESMFLDTNGEFLFVFVKVQPYLKEVRMRQPNFCVQLEKLIMRIPDAQKKLDAIKAMFVKK